MALLPMEAQGRKVKGRQRSRVRQLLVRICAALILFGGIVAFVDWVYWPSSRTIPRPLYWVSHHALPSLPRPSSSIDASPTATASATARQRFESSLLLTFKTGSSVIYQRAPLPVHYLSLSRREPLEKDRGKWYEYIPNQLFYSDAEEWIGDTHFVDVLANVSEEMKTFEGFEEYTRIHRMLANGEDPSSDAPPGSPSPGWKLDKFKFLPLHADAARRFPQVKYTISIEDDTFLFWNQIVKWLKMKENQAKGADEVKLWGAPTLLINGSLPFTHGGSGYILSRGLIQESFGQSPWSYEHNSTYAHYLRYSCCGDAELSRSFQLTIPHFKPTFSESQRLFSGEPPSRLPFVPKEWCEPILTLHKVSAFDHVRLYEFKRLVEPLIHEEDWLRRVDLWDAFMPSFLRGKVSTASKMESPSENETALLHSSIIADGWRAIPEGAGNLKPGETDPRNCQESCERAAPDSCLLWTFETSNNRCFHSDTLYIGVPSVGSTSGYQVQKINHLRAGQPCAGRLGDLGMLMTSSSARNA